jgi:SAM-dependent methyltransferase
MHTSKFRVKLKLKLKTRKKIHQLYQHKSGYMNNLDKYKDHHVTYGEVTQEGIEKLIDAYNKQPITSYDKTRRTFYDLGSGIGKNVIVVASLVPEIKSKGIEIVQERHDMAIHSHKQLKPVSLRNRIHFMCCSFMDVNLDDAAWIYLSNLCFSEQLNEQISEKIHKEVGINTMIACSKELNLPKKDYSVERLNIPMTWDNNSMSYLYKKLV